MPPSTSTTSQLTGLAALPDSGERILPVFHDTNQREAIKWATAHLARTFITGPAGTGKTTVLQEIIYQKRKATKGNPNAVAVVAPTNLAAMALGGVTLHAWLGISVDEWADKSAESLERTIRSRDAAATRVKKAELLVMDEVPYLTAEAFDKLDQVIRLLRGVGQTPFGGMPIVMAGDFYQLGPIGPRDPEPGTVLRAAFEGSSWRNGAFEKNFYFTTRYRHRGDRRFIALLDTVRTGTLSEDTLKELTELERPLPADGPPVLELCPTRHQVTEANAAKLALLNTFAMVYEAVDKGPSASNLFHECPSPAQIRLAIGCVVVLTKSMKEAGLPNGAMGYVRSIITVDTWETVGPGSWGTNPLVYDGVPWADRKRTVGSVPTKKGYEFWQWPVIQFMLGKGKLHTVLLRHANWTVNVPSTVPGKLTEVVSRRQVPVALGWATTIHKAQGFTATSCIVNLQHVFTPGQLYVALSRVTSRKRLQIVGVNTLDTKTKLGLIRPEVDAFERLILEETDERTAKRRSRTGTTSPPLPSQNDAEQQQEAQEPPEGEEKEEEEGGDTEDKSGDDDAGDVKEVEAAVTRPADVVEVDEEAASDAAATDADGQTGEKEPEAEMPPEKQDKGKGLAVVDPLFEDEDALYAGINENDLSALDLGGTGAVIQNEKAPEPEEPNDLFINDVDDTDDLNALRQAEAGYDNSDEEALLSSSPHQPSTVAIKSMVRQTLTKTTKPPRPPLASPKSNRTAQPKAGGSKPRKTKNKRPSPVPEEREEQRSKPTTKRKGPVLDDRAPRPMKRLRVGGKAGEEDIFGPVRSTRGPGSTGSGSSSTNSRKNIQRRKLPPKPSDELVQSWKGFDNM